MYVYDVRAQKKAISENDISLEAEHMLTSISTDGTDAFTVSNNIGSIALLDKRRNFKVAKKFNDHLSSISQVAFLKADNDKFISSFLKSLS